MTFNDWTITNNDDVSIYAKSGGQTGDRVTGYSRGTTAPQIIRTGYSALDVEVTLWHRADSSSGVPRILVRRAGDSDHYGFRIAPASNGDPTCFNAAIDLDGSEEDLSINLSVGHDRRSNWTHYRFTCQNNLGTAQLRFYYTDSGSAEHLAVSWDDPGAAKPAGEVGWEWLSLLDGYELSSIDEFHVEII